MWTNEEQAYYKALLALKGRDYKKAGKYFLIAENHFAENPDFRILKDVTELLLDVKERISREESEKIEIEEIINYGQEADIR
jgi:hypothetical protein